jgi:hypothetical protein
MPRRFFVVGIQKGRRSKGNITGSTPEAGMTGIDVLRSMRQGAASASVAESVVGSRLLSAPGKVPLDPRSQHHKLCTMDALYLFYSDYPNPLHKFSCRYTSSR